MDKKIILKLIIVVVVASIILTIALLLLQTKKDDKASGQNIEHGEFANAEHFVDTYGKTEDNKVDRQAYSDSVNCITQYLKTINVKNDAYYTYDEKGNPVLAIDEEKIKENIYNLLSKNYIAQNQITIQNVYEKVETLEASTLFVPLEIAMVQEKDIKSFAVSGFVEDIQDFHVIGKKTMVVNIDMKNDTFSIEPIKEDVTDIKNIKVNGTETTIEENANNKYISITSNYEETVKDYTNLYKRLALGNPEEMYKLLDKDYKQAKFGSLEKFKQYIETNKAEIIGINPQQYQVTDGENNTKQYVIIDQNGRYYIVREKGVLDYSILLDTYTIDLPEFIEKYNNSTDEQKVLFNIQKFFEAINQKDYAFAYSKLDETFKNTNFGTLAQFEAYMKKNFFSKNKLSVGKTEKQGNLYLYDINISDGEEKEVGTKKKNFVMQLKEGTDFVMSFGI